MSDKDYRAPVVGALGPSHKKASSPSVEACAARCSANPTCRTFGFVTGSKPTCSLYSSGTPRGAPNTQPMGAVR